MKNNKNYLIAGVIFLVLLAAWQYDKKQTDNYQNSSGSENNEVNMQKTDGEKMEKLTSPSDKMDKNTSQNSAGQIWEGTLKQSDNKAKGNLMLQTQDHLIYIRTSRDYTSLVGKEVAVTYQGTLDSFQLGDITAK